MAGLKFVIIRILFFIFILYQEAFSTRVGGVTHLQGKQFYHLTLQREHQVPRDLRVGTLVELTWGPQHWGRSLDWV